MADDQFIPLSTQEYLDLLRQKRANNTPPQGVVTQSSQPTDYQQAVNQSDQPQPATVQVPQTNPPLVEPRFAQTNPAAVPAATQAPVANPPPDPMPSSPPKPMSAFEESTLFPGQFKAVAEETVIEWQAPSRPFKKRNRQFFSSVFIISLLISLILFFAGQFLPIAVVFSVAFLVYVLYTVPPEDITNKITTYGLRTENDLYYWDELGRFWFEDKLGIRVLNVETLRFPGRLALVLGETQEQDLKEILTEVLINEKPKPTMTDKAANWLTEKIPLESF